MKQGDSKQVQVCYVQSNPPLSMYIKSLDESIVEVDQQLNQFKDSNRNANFSITLSAHKIGRTSLIWRVYNAEKVIENGTFNISVIHSSHNRQIIFTIIAFVFIIINTIINGCFVDLNTLKKLYNEPIALTIGLGGQFLFMPICSFLLGWMLFPTNYPIRMALFVITCSPSGCGSNFWTLFFDGDIRLSFAITAMSTLIAVVIAPIWILIHQSILLSNGISIVNYTNLLAPLLILMVSLAIGISCQKIRLLHAKIIANMKVIISTTMVTYMLGGIWILIEVFEFITLRAFLASLLVALGGLIFGTIVSMALKLPVEQLIAVSFEITLQSPAIAFLLLQILLPHPDSDLSRIAIVAEIFMVTIAISITYAIQCILIKLNIIHPYSQVQSKVIPTDDDEKEDKKDQENSADENEEEVVFEVSTDNEHDDINDNEYRRTKGIE